MWIKLLYVVSAFLITIQAWKTCVYLDSLPVNDKGRSLLAWDALVIFVVAVGLWAKLVKM